MLTLYIKYKPTGKIAENISSGDEFFENVFVKGHKNLKLRPCKTTVVFTFKEYRVVARIFFFWVLQSVHDREVDPHIFPPTRPGFPYTTRLIFRAASTGVQKIQDLFTNSHFMTRKLMFGVRRVQAAGFEQYPRKNSRR